MKNQILLIKNNDNRTDSDLDKLNEFYEFLQGKSMPDGIKIGRGHKPKMSAKKAFSIIWYLQEHLSVFPAQIEQCSVCGDLYDSYSSGIYWETKGKHFCGACDHLVPYNYDKGKR